MGYIPIFLDVTGRECVVVGGGEVAARKVESLLEAGARVTVVSPRLSPPLETIVARGLVTHIARDYQRGDIRGCVLVYAATDDPKLHRELAAEARALGIPINVVDVPELCTFIAPAVLKRGALQIAISTAGASPAFAARLGATRTSVRDRVRASRSKFCVPLAGGCMPTKSIPPMRMRRLKDLANSALPDAIAVGDVAAIERILATHLGDGVDLAAGARMLARARKFLR